MGWLAVGCVYEGRLVGWGFTYALGGVWFYDRTELMSCFRQLRYLQMCCSLCGHGHAHGGLTYIL